MFSKPVFKVPFPRIRRNLGTPQEVRNLQGKIRNLNNLLKHPRITLPELHVYVTELIKSLHGLLWSTNMIYTKQRRDVLELGYKTTSLLEDLVIRVVLRGESAQEVYMEQVRILVRQMQTTQAPTSQPTPM